MLLDVGDDGVGGLGGVGGVGGVPEVPDVPLVGEDVLLVPLVPVLVGDDVDDGLLVLLVLVLVLVLVPDEPLPVLHSL